MVLLIPGAALATSEARNCPIEPTQNVRISSGIVLAGSNCALSTGADLDSYQYSANIGDTYQIAFAIALDDTSKGDVCLELYDPNQQGIGKWCTGGSTKAIVVSPKAAGTGLYTVVLSEQLGWDVTMKYEFSLRRLYPPGTDGHPIAVGQSVTDEINPATDTDIFTFQGATTGTYRFTVGTVGNTADVCVNVSSPDGTAFPTRCTGGSTRSFQMDITPVQNGTHVVEVWESTWRTTIGYNLGLECLLGNCGLGPACTLTDTLTYDSASATLSMKFTVGNRFAATWNTWLTYQNTMESLWSEARSNTDPPVILTRTRSALPKSGKVGVLSTLTTPSKGIVCNSWTTIDTGTP